jgi:hypothetical protein
MPNAFSDFRYALKHDGELIVENRLYNLHFMVALSLPEGKVKYFILWRMRNKV